MWVYAASRSHIERANRFEQTKRLAAADEDCSRRLQAERGTGFFARLTPAPGRSPAANIFVGRVVQLAKTPLLRAIARLIMSPPSHPSREYRQINRSTGT